MSILVEQKYMAQSHSNWDDLASTVTSTVDLSGSELTNVSTAAIHSGEITSGSIYLNTNTDNWYISGIDGSSWSHSLVPFENIMPDIQQVNEMCEEYPGLKKAYENFKTAYQLVEQDWKGKKK